MNMEQLAAHYQRVELPSKTYSTQERYRNYIEIHGLPRWGKHSRAAIESVEVGFWLRGLVAANGKPASPGTRTKIRSLLSAIFSHSIRFEWANRNPITARFALLPSGFESPTSLLLRNSKLWLRRFLAVPVSWCCLIGVPGWRADHGNLDVSTNLQGAEHEREVISERVKAALGRLKAELAVNGSRVSHAVRVYTKLGGLKLPEARSIAVAIKEKNAPQPIRLMRCSQ